MTKVTKAGCGHDGPALPLDEARARIVGAATSVEGSERVPVREALGRVLAEDAVSTIDVPGSDNSAMDGYALRSADLTRQPLALRCIGASFAGKPFEGSVGEAECARIMTGAVVPNGTDTVVMQERVRIEGDTVHVEKAPTPGANVRLAGEDIRAGAVALEAGMQLQPAHIGLLASIGLGEVDVVRRPRIAFFSTGDELVQIGSVPGPGQIYDSNRYTLYSMLARLGVEIVDLGVVGDDAEALEAAFRTATEAADAVITTGGVSVGDADLVMESFERLGEVDFWSVAMKPGRPTVFGKAGDALYFGLPGNPVSVMATFYQLVRPAILALSGLAPEPMLTIRARTARSIKRRNDRVELVRGVLSEDEGGHVVDKTGAQGSGILSSMARANCFIVVPQGEGVIEAGDEVEVQPFEAFV